MKFPVKFLIAVLAFIIGLTGVIICIVPHYGPEKVVQNFFTAAEEGNVQKMLDCTVASQMGGEFAEGLLSQTNAAEIKNNVFGVPEGGTLVEVEVLGFAVDEAVVDTLAGYEVTALVKVVYKDAEGAEQELIMQESFSLMDAGNGYKITLF